jgi:integrase
VSTLRLKYVQAFRSAGATYHYFRKGGMPRIPLPGIVGSAEFMAAYQQALAAAPVPVGVDKRSKPGSISAALAEYFQSRAFKSFTGGTPVQRRNVLERFREAHGHLPLGSLPKNFLLALFDTMPPHTARTTLKALRHFVAWAVERKLMRADPTLGIRIKTPKSDGYHTWSEDEIAAFEAQHPVGSKARLAFALGLYTAQRNGDVVRFGRQNFRDGVLTVRQSKTGATLAIPVHAELAKIIDATPNTGHLTLLVTKTGKSHSPNDFSEQFRRWCDAVGLPQHCVFHGLRKAALTRLADAGCTAHEIAAISGHKTLKEVERYTKAADQARLARAAMERIGTESVKAEPAEVSKPLKSLPKKVG